MIFNTKNEETDNTKMKIRDQTTEKVKVSKFLELKIDDKLNWKEHISYVQTKLSKTTAILIKNEILTS